MERGRMGWDSGKVGFGPSLRPRLRSSLGNADTMQMTVRICGVGKKGAIIFTWQAVFRIE